MAKDVDVGIYPGAFDPITPGHLVFTTEAERVCKLNKVVFVPEQLPRNKPDVVPYSHRVEILNLVGEQVAGLHVLRLASVQFTVEGTLPELQREFPDAKLTLLVGSDVARTFPGWKKRDVLFGAVSLAIGLRGTDTPEDMTALMDGLQAGCDRPINYTLIETDSPDMSSTQVRNGTVSVWQENSGVISYIKQHGLYPEGFPADQL